MSDNCLRASLNIGGIQAQSPAGIKTNVRNLVDIVVAYGLLRAGILTIHPAQAHQQQPRKRTLGLRDGMSNPSSHNPPHEIEISKLHAGVSKTGAGKRSNSQSMPPHNALPLNDAPPSKRRNIG
ncbi:MAG: hypothetical protein ACLQU3_02140 [Limisphaerales bacterium]